MTHTTDPVTTALAHYLTELEAGELMAEEWQEVLNEVIDDHWDEVIAELGDDTIRDFFFGVYATGSADLAGFQRTIDEAIETVAQRISK